ncbi:hypothetical protein [Bifidobacterium sp. ESL0704]|uniref:hypothetical protein n=1 Tax=Bifidobacterium sp. ESL0704 TaxID=2983219 RepID=UPI0023F88E59|nr:hypothetical protein [Bifidobacterium sp. ESL0704]WEV52811.1 hypothetical protein OZX64_08130 [Bifidobacterium sp. ESL0704]
MDFQGLLRLIGRGEKTCILLFDNSGVACGFAGRAFSLVWCLVPGAWCPIERQCRRFTWLRISENCVLPIVLMRAFAMIMKIGDARNFPVIKNPYY